MFEGSSTTKKGHGRCAWQALRNLGHSSSADLDLAAPAESRLTNPIEQAEEPRYLAPFVYTSPGDPAILLQTKGVAF